MARNPMFQSCLKRFVAGLGLAFAVSAPSGVEVIALNVAQPWQRALGRNSKAVHHAYSKHAEVTVPSLDDWETQWKKNPQGIAKPAVVQVDFMGSQAGVADVRVEEASTVGLGR
jgi:hypothetical protein